MSSAGETDLGVLLASMQPELVPGEFVYCTVPARGRRAGRLRTRSSWCGSRRA